MFTKSDVFQNQGKQELKIQKRVMNHSMEILSISLEKGAIFPEHTSSKDTQRILMEGVIVFHIHGEAFQFKKHRHFSFSKEIPHWVEANENSKFLII